MILFSFLIVFAHSFSIDQSARIAFSDPLERKNALEARDGADLEALTYLIHSTRDKTLIRQDFEAELKLALLNHWLLEAAYLRTNFSTQKGAALEGLGAAEAAVKLK